MSFIKEVDVYNKGKVRVYINECHRVIGLKTRIFAVRRDGKIGCARYLGLIKWGGAWRQYVFQPTDTTQWSKGCLKGIADFMEDMTKKHWKRLRKLRLIKKRGRLDG